MADDNETPSPPPNPKRRNWKWLLLLTIVCSLCAAATAFLSNYIVSVDRLAQNTTVTHHDHHYWKELDVPLSSSYNEYNISDDGDAGERVIGGSSTRLGRSQSKYHGNGTRRHRAGNSAASLDGQMTAHESSDNFQSPSHHSPNKNNTYNFTADIHLVSLTVRADFYILFNNSAMSSWVKHIQNVRSVTFIGPPNDYNLFVQNMNVHYPNYLLLNAHDDKSTIKHNNAQTTLPPVRWINETHWITTYKNRYRCPYPGVCQQLIKLYVFDLRTQLGFDYIGDNVLIVDSDTVWARNVTFVDPTDGGVKYFEAYDTGRGTACSGMDPVKFTEGITVGMSKNRPQTLTPFTACRRAEYPNATGARHIVHHMLFQYDVMMHLHSIIAQRWGVSTLWQAFNKCHSYQFCKSRVAEYELYHSFVTNQYPERVRSETLTNGINYMGSSAICDATEINCCEERGVILKGCHDHRVNKWRNRPENPGSLGDMCCGQDVYGVNEVIANNQQFLLHGM